MAEEKKKGFWARLFGPKESACCSLKIEEVKEGDAQDSSKEDPEAAKAEGSPAAPGQPTPQEGSCCCGPKKPSPGGKCCG